MNTQAQRRHAQATLLATCHVKTYLQNELKVEESEFKNAKEFFQDHDACYLFTNGDNLI